jgi:hypothetical protein
MVNLRFAATDLRAPRSLVNCGVVATGCDAETCDVQPAPDPGMPSNSQRVHTCLLIESGVYIMESLYLENLAPESAFVAMPIKFACTTDSRLDAVAVVS